uniref:C3HC-type domain-containing protein n=1 Tax=Macrostomum lignano TaxID=282301 RepID=A0A1I8GV48_9PLAT
MSQLLSTADSCSRAVAGLADLADEFSASMRQEYLDSVASTPAASARSWPDQSALVGRIRARQACREEAEDAASIRNLPRVSDFKNRLSQLRCDEDIDAFDSCWCWNRRLTAWELASAGFLPVNNGIDRVKCYCCNLELRLDWTEMAPPCDAWVQHARWSPRCAHVLGERGVEFVLTVRTRMPAFVG